MTNQTTTTRRSDPLAGLRELSHALSGVTEEDVEDARVHARRARRRVARINRIKQYCGLLITLSLTTVFVTACAWGVAILVDLWP